MKRYTYIFILLITFFITSGCQKKSETITLITLDSSISSYEDSSKKINLSELINTNGNSDDLIYSVTVLPEHGNVDFYKDSESNEFIAYYFPDSDYYGNDSFEYQVSYGDLSSSGKIAVRVKSHNDEPRSSHTHLMTYENTALTFDLSSIVIDIDSEELIFVIEVTPNNGLLKLNGSVISYTPNTGFNGIEEFRYAVRDNQGGSSVNTISIDVISEIGSND